ncbi:uncharacterized protein RSE6_11728 [Rhynchosporium secalis]|uniref:Uncharacterized protein n=1 Tax=Rhynchosporium secalis TaxID=38038 RepID=A0A1E1MNQ8_RHYSE|nr:uncharacterized protein RSE6_11728 [Rhynchosporium secalis]
MAPDFYPPARPQHQVFTYGTPTHFSAPTSVKLPCSSQPKAELAETKPFHKHP